MATRLEYLSVAREFIEHGIPVFVAKRNPKYDQLVELPSGEWKIDDREYFYPKGWQEFSCSPGRLAGWVEGDALCAITGWMPDNKGINVIDVDVKTSGWAESLNLLKSSDALPYHGSIRTPSGGFHLYTTITDIRTIVGAWPGIDFKGGDRNGLGRGFVFLPGTFRPKYNLKGYEPLDPFDWEKLQPDWNHLVETQQLDPSWQTLVSVLRALQEQRIPGLHGDGKFHGELTNEKIHAVVERFTAVVTELKKRARPGNRNDELNKAAFITGGLISGQGMNEEVAVEHLTKVAIELGLQRSEAVGTILSGIKKGRYVPIYGEDNYPMRRA